MARNGNNCLKVGTIFSFLYSQAVKENLFAHISYRHYRVAFVSAVIVTDRVWSQVLCFLNKNFESHILNQIDHGFLVPFKRLRQQCSLEG